MRYLLLLLLLIALPAYATDTALIDRDGTTTPVTLGSGAYSPAMTLTNTAPNMDSIASAGSGSTAARVDHIHPSDTSKANVENPTFTGTATAPLWSSNSADGTHYGLFYNTTSYTGTCSEGMFQTVGTPAMAQVCNNGSWVNVGGGSAIPKTQLFTKCALIKGATTADDYPIERFPYPTTISKINVYPIGGTNVVGGLDICSAAGGLCSSVTAVDADITATAGANTQDDGTLTNPSIPPNTWVQWHTTSVSGTNTSLSVCWDYTMDDPGFVYDSFNGTTATLLSARTGETGATWTKHTSFGDGTAQLTSNALTTASAGSGNTNAYYASGTPSSADYSVEANFKALTTDVVNSEMGVAARINTAAKTAYLCAYKQGIGKWIIGKYLAGGYADLGNGYAQAISAGTNYKVKLTVTGSHLYCYVNDSLVTEYTSDPDITAAGKAGVTFRNGSSTTGYSFLDFKAY